MGIREELGKLRKYDNMCVDAILSILDEHLGELVTEITCDEEMEFELVWDTKMGEMIPKVFRSGDHISIYVRR